MKMESLRVFQTIAHLGNINKAAEFLFTSHQNLSYMIKKMEQELGVDLLIRKNDGVILTEEGERFLQVIEPIVSSYDTFLAELSTRIDTPVFQMYTTPYLEKYIARIPGFLYSDQYYISLHKRNVNELVAMLENGQQGVYLLPVYYNDKHCVVAGKKEGIALGADKNILFCHRSNKLLRESDGTLEQFRKQPVISTAYTTEKSEKDLWLNIEDIAIAQKFMREKGFCYSGTYLTYGMDFHDTEEWPILGEEDSHRYTIEYNLLFCLPDTQKRVAKQFLLEPLQTQFSIICNQTWPLLFA